jgi:hypothetical protein
MKHTPPTAGTTNFEKFFSISPPKISRPTAKSALPSPLPLKTLNLFGKFALLSSTDKNMYFS